MFLIQLSNIALGWDIMWKGMSGIFAAIAVIVFIVWAFTKVGMFVGKKPDNSENPED